eukprot:950117_1
MSVVELSGLIRWSDTQFSPNDIQRLLKETQAELQAGHIPKIAVECANNRKIRRKLKLYEDEEGYSTTSPTAELDQSFPFCDKLKIRSNPSKSENGDSTAQVRFPLDPELNKRIILWRGRITRLRVGALVNSIHENMCRMSSVSREVLARAGEGLEREYARIGRCKTASVGACKGYDLYAHNVIHTVSPRYHAHFHVAAENALHTCVRESLTRAVDLGGVRSVALPVVNLPEKGFPPEDAAHVVIRTVRRFLEHQRVHSASNSLLTVVFCMSNARDERVYTEILPMYFPRSVEEQTRVGALLPEYTGDANGATAVRERSIRISGHMKETRKFHNDQSHYILSQSNDCRLSNHFEHDFMRMRPPPDETRSTKPLSRSEINDERLDREYHRILDEARLRPASDFESLDFIYSSGKDKFGRRVLVIIGELFPLFSENSENSATSAFHKLILTADRAVRAPYVVVYAHGGSNERTLPPDWVRQSWRRLACKYSYNLVRLYIIHPTFYLRFWVFLSFPIMKGNLFRKIVYIRDLADIYNDFDAGTLNLPATCFDHDSAINGTDWSHQRGSFGDFLSIRNDEECANQQL